MQEIGINSVLLKEIVAGRKTVETRLAKERFLTFKPGDVISIREDIWEDNHIIWSVSRAAQIRVANSQRFDSFRTMFDHINYGHVIPSGHSIDEALEAYEQYYDEADEKKYGVVAISFEIV